MGACNMNIIHQVNNNKKAKLEQQWKGIVGSFVLFWTKALIYYYTMHITSGNTNNVTFFFKYVTQLFGIAVSFQ